MGPWPAGGGAKEQSLPRGVRWGKDSVLMQMCCVCGASPYFLSRMKKWILSLAAIALVFGPVASGYAADKIRVASLSTILTEVASEVGGDRVQVVALVKPGTDPHQYEPKPADLKELATCRLVLASGKHMEGYITKLKESAGVKGDLILVGDRFPSLKMRTDEGGKGSMVEDPHWWHSVENVQRAAQIVRDELTKVSPEAKDDFSKNASAYVAGLESLKKWAKHKVTELPREKRILITSHDAFQYFAKENGFKIQPVQGLSTEDEPSNKKVSQIIEVIKKDGVKAVFFGSMENPKVTKELMRESGAKVGGTLYADGLTARGEASTYEGMIRHNITTIVDALK
jgi:zinc/manganese transport system substrate-binding protein